MSIVKSYIEAAAAHGLAAPTAVAEGIVAVESGLGLDTTVSPHDPEAPCLMDLANNAAHGLITVFKNGKPEHIVPTAEGHKGRINKLTGRTDYDPNARVCRQCGMVATPTYVTKPASPRVIVETKDGTSKSCRDEPGIIAGNLIIRKPRAALTRTSKQ